MEPVAASAAPISTSVTCVSGRCVPEGRDGPTPNAVAAEKRSPYTPKRVTDRTGRLVFPLPVEVGPRHAEHPPQRSAGKDFTV